MKLLKKIVAGLLLLWGLPLSIWATVYTLDPNNSSEDKEGSIAALIFFGLPPVAISGLLIHSLYQQHRDSEQKSDSELEQLFLTEIQTNDGVISPVFFALKAELSIEDAKAYLDKKAVQLNGLYEVSESGGVIYRFLI
ncbi:MAG: hypothetical protein AAGG53_01810 [Cyanobacteria bacterium P01_H01_bin.152]